MLQSIYSLDHK